MFSNGTGPTFPSQSHIVVTNACFGQSPSGFKKLHLELRPKEAIRLIGYDPRSLVIKAGRVKATANDGAVTRPKRSTIPANVSSQIVAMQNSVQRSIDTARTGSMVEYLRGPFERGDFADWGAITLVTASQPEQHDSQVWLDPDAEYFICDGQHRYAALCDFVRDFPQYSDRFTQGLTILVIPEDRLAQWAGQAFHDLNYFAVAVRPGKALSTDTRDPINQLARELDQHPEIQRAGGIAYERDTLLAKDARFSTHSVMHRFVRAFLMGRPGVDKTATADITPEAKNALFEYVSALSLIMPWFGAPDDRDAFLTRSSVVLTALAVVGHDLYSAGLSSEDVGRRLANLAKIDWRRSNLGLVGIVGSEKAVKNKEGVIVGSEVQPASSRQAIDATIRYFRERMGLLSPPGSN